MDPTRFRLCRTVGALVNLSGAIGKLKPLFALAFLLWLAGCQNQPAAVAPEPADTTAIGSLANFAPDGVVATLNEPLLMRYRSAGPFNLTASTTVRAIADGRVVVHRDTLHCRLSLTDAGEGLLRLDMDWRVDDAELSDHLPQHPFQITALITDLGAVLELNWEIHPAEQFDHVARAQVFASLQAYLPLLEWPERPLEPAEVAHRLSPYHLAGTSNGNDRFGLFATTTIPGGLPGYLVTFARGDDPDDASFSGHVLIDRSSGLPFSLEFNSTEQRQVTDRAILIETKVATSMSP